MNAAEPSPPGGELDLLRERAAKLARPAPPADAGHASALAFSVAGQPCLVELAWVREVRPLRGLLPIPLAQGPVLGLVQLRNGMLPVLDIAPLLGATGDAADAPSHLLVLGRDAPVVAIAADIDGLAALATPDAERRGDELAELRPEIVRGVTGEGCLVLDPERLLALQRTPSS
jgi:purine-binding chemotaxis protein CheW